MIFVTAGTTTFPFHRLEKVVLTLAELFPNERIVYQNSKSGIVSFPKKVEVITFINPKDFIKLLKEARVIVSHAGYATVLKAIKHSKTKPIVIPRLAKYKEHVNDHQLYFAKFMEEIYLVSVVNRPDQVKDTMKQNKIEPAIVENYLDNVSRRRKKLVKFLNDLGIN